MSETEATAAPTAEEIKGTKRAAEDDVDLAKKQKTENGANGSNGAAVVAAENGAEVEEEEDVDEEDEEALGEERTEGQNKSLVTFLRHVTFRYPYFQACNIKR